jgi:hypothetical protein
LMDWPKMQAVYSAVFFGDGMRARGACKALYGNPSL